MLKRFVLILAIIAPLSACQDEPYKAGVWMGPTGANVAQMIETEVNFSGGASGRRFKTRVVAQRDVVWGELTPQTLAASLDSMATDPSVLAVLTRMTDSTTERLTRKYEESGMAYLVATPVSRNYAETHPHAFMLVPSLEEQAEFLATQALAEAAPRRVAIVHLREDYAASMAGYIKRALAAKGITPVLETSYARDADEVNMLAKAQEISVMEPTILYFIGRSPSLMLLHPTIRNKNPDIRVLANDLVESFHVYQNPQGIYTGLRFLRYMDPTSPDSATRAVRERMVMWIGRDELTNEAAITFDALHGVVKAIRAGATTRQAVYEYMKKQPSFSGITGTVTFGPDQRAIREMHMAEVWPDGVKRVELAPAVAARR